jgi:outer membrane protein
MTCKSLLVLLILLSTATSIAAEENPSEPATEEAKYLISVGRIQEAQILLDRILVEHPDDVDARFIRATLAADDQRWSEAIEGYRRILDQHPELVRVRLDYARALFETNEDEESDYNFRLVLPQVPKPVSDNIRVFLNAINARKTFSYNLSFGVAPDSNINAASSVNQLTLFGLPFTLSNNAQQKSGVGIVVNLSGEYRVALSSDWRARGGGALYRDSYIGHSDFDDMIARVYAGPQFLFDQGDVSLLAVADQRWFANDPYSYGYGPRAEFNYLLTDAVAIQSSLEYTPVWYHTNTFQNGHLLTGLVTTSYALTPTSFLSLITGISKEHDASPDFSNISYRIGVGYQRELPAGITAYVQPDAIFSDYAAPSPSFGTTRRDRTVRLQLTLLKRDIRFQGFSPSVTYSFSQDLSNQALFAYTRHQLLIGFSRSF